MDTNAAMRRLDDMEVRADTLQRAELDRLKADHAANQARLREAEADRVARIRESQRELQASVDPVYQRWGMATPAPRGDEGYHDYQKRVLRDMQRHLPADSGFTRDKLDVRPLESGPLRAFTPGIVKAFNDALYDPRTVPYGEMRPITEVDGYSGLRTTEWVGRRSFIADIAQAPRRVRGGLNAIRETAMLLLKQR
jgi:hypothetical protein